MATRRTSRSTARRRQQLAHTRSTQSLYRRPLRFEPLEDRRLLALVTVTTLDDSVNFNDSLTSLREAIFATNLVAGADTIEFSPSLTASGPVKILLTQGELKITDSLTINGPGANLLTIDASGNDPTPDERNGDGGRHFNIDDGTSDLIEVSMSDVTLAGSTLFSSGRVILDRENLSLSRISIVGETKGANYVIAHFVGLLSLSECTISGNFDGAINSTGGNVEIANSTFADNFGLFTRESCIYVTQGNLTVTHSTISNNGPNCGVGVVNGNLGIMASTISGNVGGIFARNAEVYVVDSNILDNRSVTIPAATYAGGIGVNGGSISIVRSTITGNSSSSIVQGGGIWIRNGTALSVVDSTVANNDAPFGGGIRISGGTASIVHSTIAGNTSDFPSGSNLKGAGIDSQSADLTIVDSTISGNSGQNSAGVRWNGTKTFQIRDSRIENNYFGILVSPIGGTATITNNTVTGNVQGIRTLAAGNGTVSIVETTVSGNSNAVGAGIFVSNSSNGTTAITRSTITGNIASVLGGGVFLYSGNATISESTISENSTMFGGPGSSSNLGGGGLYVAPGAAVTISDCIIFHNSSQGLGGGLFVRGIATILRTEIKENHAAFDGGGMALLGRATIADSQVLDNQSSGRGGGVYVFPNTSVPSGTRTIIRSTVSGNSAASDGGGVYSGKFVSSPLSVIDSTISHNLAVADGGGVTAGFGTTIQGCAIFGNSAVSGGGALLSGGVLKQSTISGNSAAVGGGIFALQSTRIENSTIAFNSASSLGGGAFVSSGTLTLYHSIVAQNTTSLPTLGPDVSGVIGTTIEPHFSLIGRNNGSGLTAAPVGSPDANGNLIGGSNSATRIDPLLGPLVDNGGPTPMHALLPDSPALNAGDPSAVAGLNGIPLFDQRGGPFGRVFGGRIDIGAFERQPNPLPGDYDFNGVVDLADSLVWRETRGSTTDLRADGNEDGVVNDADRAIWMANFGKTRAGELVLGNSTASPIDGRQPSALPGVSPSVMVVKQATPENMIRSVNSAVVLPSVRSAYRPATKTAASPLSTAVKQDAALVAWLTSRTQSNVLRDDSVRLPKTEDRREVAATALSTAALDCAFRELSIELQQ